MLALTLLVAAVVTFAFTRPVKKVQEKKSTDVIYQFILTGTPSQADFEDETKWVEISEQEAEQLDCSGTGSVCQMLYTDQVGSVNPPTLPSGFDPYLQPHVKRAP